MFDASVLGVSNAWVSVSVLSTWFRTSVRCVAGVVARLERLDGH